MWPLLGALAFVAVASLDSARAQERTIAEWIDALHLGDARAPGALARHGESALGPLLEDLEGRARAGAIAHIEADLRALSTLGRTAPSTLERLIAVLDRLEVPDPARAGLQTRILRTIGDLAAGAGAVPVFERWLESQPADPLRGAVVRRGGTEDRIPIVSRTELSRVETRWRHRHEQKLAGLLVLVESDDVDAAELAAERLAAFGSEASPALPALWRLLQSQPDSTVQVKTNRPAGIAGLPHLRSEARTVAAAAIVAIAPRSKEAIQAHATLLQSGTTQQRVRSLAALRERNDFSPRIVALVVPLVQERDPLLRREAITTLGALGPAAKSALPALERLSRHEDPQVATAARSAIRQIRER